MRALWTSVTLLGCVAIGVSYQKQGALASSEGTSAKSKVERCSPNRDSRYDRQTVLLQFADVLNDAAPGFKKYQDHGFHVDNEKPQHFFIFDLTVPSNRSTPSSGCIDLLNRHIYHFAARYIPFSLSHVAFLDDGKMKIFRAINCKNSKENIDDVTKYVAQRLNLRENDEVLQRVRDYRKYGEYFTVDDLVIRCEQLDPR